MTGNQATDLRAKKRRGEQLGFTLLEALVAMVLISGIGVSLFAWINTELESGARLQEANARTDATVNALEFMESVNPMLKPEGRVGLNAFGLSWQAREITEPMDGVSYPQGISLYRLAMYETSVTLARPDGSAWFVFPLQQVGYKRVRDNKSF